MSSFVKGKLKGAREALGKKDYQAACDAASQVLEYEPENYNANVFLGLSLLELGQIDKSEQAYRKAIDLNPDQILAWQGLSKFYERTQNWEKYIDTLHNLVRLFSKSNDSIKCAETLQKIIDTRRENGSRVQLIEALSLLLPESPFYNTLSTLPPPDPTNPTSTSTFVTQAAVHDSLPIIEEIVLLTEKNEAETIKKEYDKQRLRLGAPSPGQLKKDIDVEVLGASSLPKLYNEVLNHPNTTDALRRTTEAKLLRQRQRYLHALPSTGPLSSAKASVALQLEELVNGVIVLGIPDELAWMIHIEGKNNDSIEGYDFSTLRQYMEIFPSSPLTSLLKGYFTYIGISISIEKDEAEAVEEDVLDQIIDTFSSLTDSILASRILADLYLQELDYENAIKVSESGLELVRRAEANNGRELSQVQKAFNIILATSLVHLFPPKHHPRALRIIEEILTREPDNVPCLMGRAYIIQHLKKWTEAGELFAKVAGLVPDDLDIGLRAKEEHAWCQIQACDTESGIATLKRVINDLDQQEERDEDKARCLWRLGSCYWNMGADEKREEAYRLFITALKRNPAFAPAFTSLGIYYSEFSTPRDPVRASKCFQKAFELDAREANAARRLAAGFAEEREWDLVEVVARRTIDGEGGLNAGLQGGDGVNTGRYLPTNSWAWKAVGVVELNRRNYPLAISAFQVALRADPDDQLSWVRLGEAYSKAGRQAAAIKALGRAHELQPEDWMCSYFIAEVHRQTGQFHEALKGFETILSVRPYEAGVLMSLGRAHLELGLFERSRGFMARAEESFFSAIRVGLEAVQQIPGFRGVAWKIIADGVFHLSNFSSFSYGENTPDRLAQVASLIAIDPDRRLSGILPTDLLPSDRPSNGFDALALAVASYSYRISLSSSDAPVVASAWYDLGISLHLWSMKVISSDVKDKSTKQSIVCLTEALRGDPGNDTCWNALGNAHFVSQPKTAQHAYIKALEIDPKNVVTWTNLGLLCLHHEDLELANEAFYRAQTLDPDYTIAWVGQGLVATANGHNIEARALFEHAVGLTADVPEADLEYALRVFSRISLSTKHEASSYDRIFPAFFVLDRYCKQRPDDATALHLFALICERLSQMERAVDLIRRAISILEAAYEETEDPVIERQFTIANSNLARILLSAHDYEGALESFESALGLLPENDDDQTIILRVQAQFGSGLASFNLGNLEDALSLLEGAIQTANGNNLIQGQASVLLAQILWALGTDEFKESAKAKLLECITSDPENLAAINTLAGMGILTEDDNLVDAALLEILSLPVEQRHRLDPERNVDYLLIQHHLGQGDLTQALAVAQKATFAEPSLLGARRDLATLIMQQGDPSSALAVLTRKEGDFDTLRESLGLHALAESLTESVEEGLRQAQKAIMLSPWKLENWQILAYIRGLAAK